MRRARAGARALEQAGLRGDVVRSVVFVAPWKGIIPVGVDGDVLRNAIIWMDSRAAAEAERLNEARRGVRRYRSGILATADVAQAPRTGTLGRRAGDHRRNTYLKWMATGVVATEPSDDFISSDRPSLQARYRKFSTRPGSTQDIAKFPPSTAAGDIVGPLTEAAAAHLGLPAGVPVFGGFGDLPAITSGANALVAGATHIYLGTSSWLLCVLEANEKLESPLRVTLNSRYDGAIFCLQSACLAFDWIVEQIYGRERAERGDAFLDFVNEQVAQVGPGAENLLATHWLTGELPPFSKNAKGVFLNLTPVHDRRHMVRAMMESICYSHRMSIEWFESQAARRLDDIRVVGGGACSGVWMQMLADVLGRTIVVPDAPRFVGAIGAYRCTLGSRLSGARFGRRRTVQTRRPRPRHLRPALHDLPQDPSRAARHFRKPERTTRRTGRFLAMKVLITEIRQETTLSISGFRGWTSGGAAGCSNRARCAMR